MGLLDPQLYAQLLANKQQKQEQLDTAPAQAFSNGLLGGMQNQQMQAQKGKEDATGMWKELLGKYDLQKAVKDPATGSITYKPFDGKDMNNFVNYTAKTGQLPKELLQSGSVKFLPKTSAPAMQINQSGVAAPVLDVNGNPVPKGNIVGGGSSNTKSMGNIDYSKLLSDPNKINESKLTIDDVKPAYRQTLQGILDYKSDPTRIASTRGDAPALYALASTIKGEPIDQTLYNQKYKTAQDFAPNGKSGKNLTSLNTAIGHLDSLLQASQHLDNSKIKKYNNVANWFKNESGSPEVARFKAAENAVAGEMATVFKGTSGTDQEIQSWKSAIDASQSPEQARAVVEQMVDLMKSRVDTIGGQWNSLMGDKPLQMIYPKSKKTLLKYGYDENLQKVGGGQSTPNQGSSDDPLGIFK